MGYEISFSIIIKFFAKVRIIFFFIDKYQKADFKKLICKILLIVLKKFIYLNRDNYSSQN